MEESVKTKGTIIHEPKMTLLEQGQELKKIQ